MDQWHLELSTKPDFDQAMARVNAWYNGEIIDRAPVRFSNHNAEYVLSDSLSNKSWPTLRDRWMDVEYQVMHYAESMKGKKFLGETFPVYMPNLGPNIFASFYGCPIEFGEVTSWAEPFLSNPDDTRSIKMNWNNEYLRTLDEMTDMALEVGKGHFMVGYTDLHPGMDCAAAWRGTENLCMDLYDDPDFVSTLISLAEQDFLAVYDRYDKILKKHNQLSVTWMGIPSYGRMHIPSCDFSAMISGDLFEEFAWPHIQEEMKTMTHNIFHLDGKDVARHLDVILKQPEIQAIQWVQGVGDDKPIMQWLPLIRKMQNAGKSVVVDLDVSELEPFIGEISPKGLYMCINASDPLEQERIINRLLKWK